MPINREDLHHSVDGLNAFSTAAITTNTTTNGITINRLDYLAIEYFVKLEAVAGTGVFNVVLQESDDGSSWADVDSSEVLGSASFNAASDILGTVKRIGTVSKKQYSRLTIVSTGVATGSSLAATAVLANPRYEPVADNS
jgi:hypothetical protein